MDVLFNTLSKVQDNKRSKKYNDEEYFKHGNLELRDPTWSTQSPNEYTMRDFRVCVGGGGGGPSDYSRTVGSFHNQSPQARLPLWDKISFWMSGMLRDRLGFCWFCGVSNDGFSYGLALLWDESLHVTILDSCQYYIDVTVLDPGYGVQWRSTLGYGKPWAENCHFMWEHMVRLRNSMKKPWLVRDDFNEALLQHQHQSRTARAEPHMAVFMILWQPVN